MTSAIVTASVVNLNWKVPLRTFSMSLCDEVLPLHARHPAAGDADPADTQIARQIMRILTEHSPPASAENLASSRQCIEQDRFADLTQALVRLVRQDRQRSASPQPNQLQQDDGIVETIPVPDVYGQQYLQVASTLRRSTSNFGSVSSRSVYNMEQSGNPLQTPDEHDSVLEGKTRETREAFATDSNLCVYMFCIPCSHARGDTKCRGRSEFRIN